MNNQDVLLSLEASPIRRAFALAVLLLLAAMLLWIAAVHPPVHPGWRIFLVALGVGAVWLADLLRRATMLRLDLTPESLVCSDGRLIARIADIESVDRGFFAFKPSNGFLLRLRKPSSRSWAPGVFWVTGKRVGVGGVTAAPQAKAMVEVISAMLAERTET